MRLFGVQVPRSCKICGFPMLWKMKGGLHLGERVMMNSIPELYPMGATFPRCALSAMPGASVSIGDDSYLASCAVFAAKEISIGKRVLISSGCRISDHDGHPVDRIPRTTFTTEGAEPVHIEDDVWLGCDVMILKGVTIGRGSVIGAKSLVTNDIPPNVLAAGNPARIIRELRFGERQS